MQQRSKLGEYKKCELPDFAGKLYNFSEEEDNKRETGAEAQDREEEFGEQQALHEGEPRDKGEEPRGDSAERQNLLQPAGPEDRHSDLRGEQRRAEQSSAEPALQREPDVRQGGLLLPLRRPEEQPELPQDLGGPGAEGGGTLRPKRGQLHLHRKLRDGGEVYKDGERLLLRLRRQEAPPCAAAVQPLLQAVQPRKIRLQGRGPRFDGPHADGGLHPHNRGGPGGGGGGPVLHLRL